GLCLMDHCQYRFLRPRLCPGRDRSGVTDCWRYILLDILLSRTRMGSVLELDDC
ncbi:MAG: hypothetical protein Q9183_007697, partial [Haloplaca sp. 2 TL-2023]